MAAHVLGINPVAGVPTTFKVRFQVAEGRPLPARALVHVYFPTEFRVESDAVASKRNIECDFEVLKIEQAGTPGAGAGDGDARQCITLGVPRQENDNPKKPPKPPEGEMAAAGATVGFILNKIRNPGFSGRSGKFRIVVVDPQVSEEEEVSALEARQAALDAGKEVDEAAVIRRTLVDATCRGNVIQAGSLENCAVELENLKINKMGSARVSFQCFNAVPADGQIAITFDEAFTGIAPTEVAVEDGVFGDVEVSVHPDNPRCVLVRRPRPEEDGPGDETDAAEEAAAAAVAAAAAAPAPASAKGGGKKSKGGAKAAEAAAAAAAAEEEEAGDKEDEEYDTLVPKSHEGTRVVLQVNGISNPATPGPRSKGALQDRLYQIETQTAAGAVIDEERAVAASKFVTSVDLGVLMDFVFPPAQQHPNSTGRLIVYGLYGPLDEAGKLRGGQFGSHAVSDFEVACMVRDVERADLLSVFTDDKGLLYDEEDEIIRNLGDARDRLLQRFSRPEVEQLLAGLELDEDGGASFHDIQKLILEVRAARVNACKVMYPDLAGGSAVGRKKKQPPKKKPPQRGGPKMYGGLQKYNDNEAFEVVLKLLHKNASKIVNPTDPNAPGTTANVWLLRHEEPLPEGQVPWDSTACLRGQGSNQLRMNRHARAKGLPVNSAGPKRLSAEAAAAKAMALAAAAATKPWGHSTPKPSSALAGRGADSVARTSPWTSQLNTRRAPPSTAQRAEISANLARSAKTKPW